MNLILLYQQRDHYNYPINKNLLIENKLVLQKGVQIEIQELANKLTCLVIKKIM